MLYSAKFTEVDSATFAGEAFSDVRAAYPQASLSLEASVFLDLSSSLAKPSCLHKRGYLPYHVQEESISAVGGQQ
jgi:hypothetical protein